MTAGGILLVCTANRARSPMAQLILERFLGDARRDIPLGSAGTRGVDGEHVTRHTRQVLDARGIDAGGFRSRELTADLIDGADLILCAERAHRADVVRLVPRAHRKTFTMTQAARLLDVAGPADDAGSVAELTAKLAASRGIAPQSPDDDVADPAGGSLAEYEVAAGRISAAMRSVADALR